MASIVITERVALYDNSRKDESGKSCYMRLPWNIITVRPGVGGSPATNFLEPVSADLTVSATNVKTVSVPYHRVEYVDAKDVYGFNVNRGTGGENRADE